MAIVYKGGSELPNPEINWRDSDGATRDFSTGWTALVRVGLAAQAALIEKTTDITLTGPTAPNITIAWDPGELDVLNFDTVYDVDIEMTFGGTGQSITLSFEISRTSAVLPALP